MPEDSQVKIKTKFDNSLLGKGLTELEKFLKKVSDKLKSHPITKSASEIGQSFIQIKGALSPVGTAVNAVTNTFKAAAAAIAECTDAYRVQAQAETQLESAAMNNPYLNNSAVNGLKSFASELQGMSTYGDEALLPLMGQLAAAGRTEKEIKEIMKASIDIAASGSMSIESAVKNLNKSFSGLSGELGESVPAIKNLTEEELKAGKAVEVLGAQYKGMAANVAEATGSQQQLANSMGDLKEEIGSMFEKPLSAVRKFFQSIVDGWTESLKQARKYKEGTKNIRAGKADSGDFEDVIAGKKRNIAKWEKLDADQYGQEAYVNYKILIDNERADLQKLYYEMYTAQVNEATSLEQLAELREKLRAEDVANFARGADTKLAIMQSSIEKEKALNKDLYTQRINELKSSADAEKLRSEIGASSALVQEKRLELLEKLTTKTKELKEAEAVAAEKERAEFIKKNQEELAAAKQKLEIEAKAKGTTVSKEDTYNAEMASYIALLSGANTEGARYVTTEDAIAKARKQSLSVLAEQIAAQGKADFIKGNAADLDVQLQKLEAEAQAKGTHATAQEKLNAGLSAYQALITGTNEAGALYVSMEDECVKAAQARIDSLKEEAAAEEAVAKALAAAQKEREAIQQKYEETLKTINGRVSVSLLDQLEAEKAFMTEHGATLKEAADAAAASGDAQSEANQKALRAYEEYAAAMILLDKQITQAQKDQLAERLTQVNAWAQSFESTVNKFTEMFTEHFEACAQEDAVVLQKQYDDGIISYEEYEARHAEIDKKLAEQKYKLELYNWSASLLTATANIAQGIAACCAQGYPIGLITGALVAAAGVAQIASIVQNRPRPPAFAQGGIVGGTSYSGDNVQANVNSGEMILNAAQQKQLWQTANGKGGAGGMSLNVVIENNAAADTGAKAAIDSGVLRVTIDKLVNTSMTEGRYNDSMAQGQAKQQGASYL